MTNRQKEVPEYDENITCTNPECIAIEAEVLGGLYGIVGGGGVGAYTMCEHCGTLLSKSLDPSVEHEPPKTETSDVQSPEDH